MENKNGDTYVSESQIIAEEVLFELGQSGSANPHRRSLPWLNSNTLIVTETSAFSDGKSKHSQERRKALKAKTLCRVRTVVQPFNPPEATHCKRKLTLSYTRASAVQLVVLYHKIFQQSLNSNLKVMQAFTISGFSSYILMFGRTRRSFMTKENK